MGTLWSKENRNFVKDLATGKRGERDILEYLLDLSDTKTVSNDISNSKKGIEDDIDFEVLSESEFYTAELKTDLKAHYTGNLPYERYSNGNPGCMWRSKANYFIFYIPQEGLVLWLDPGKWKEHIMKKDPSELRKMGQGAEGYLDKITALREKGIIIYEDKHTAKYTWREQDDNETVRSA